MATNDTNREMKASIEDVNPLFRPIFPNSEDGFNRSFNWISVILFVSALVLLTCARIGAGADDWMWVLGAGLAFASGVLHGIYYDDSDQYDDEIEDDVLDDAYRANSEHDERINLIRRLTD